MFLIKSAFVGKKALYLPKCTVKQQLKLFLGYLYYTTPNIPTFFGPQGTIIRDKAK